MGPLDPPHAPPPKKKFREFRVPVSSQGHERSGSQPLSTKGFLSPVFFMVYVHLKNTRPPRLYEDGIKFSPSSPIPVIRLTSSVACGSVPMTDLSLTYLLGSGHCPSTFVCLQFRSLQSRLLFIGDSCCYVAQVLWHLARQLLNCLLQKFCLAPTREGQ
uniref:Uncharacterized protein n=1 Tax=Aegilops tauschii subsp. strangulata TaxID=200361 RepID=A0A453F4I5_AEGTS